MKCLITVVLSLICLSLNSCIAVAVTAVGATAIVERKNISLHLSNRELESRINERLSADKNLHQDNHIIVTALTGEVLLVGQIQSETDRHEIMHIVENTDGVTKIYDQLTVGTPTSFGQRAKDSMISSKISTKIFTKTGAKVDVTTENGVVYLMGTVTQSQSEAATKFARTTNGVTQVVKIFTYTT